MSEGSLEILDPISITAAAPGWRAVLIFPEGRLLIEPLIGWGVFDVSDVLLDADAAVPHRGRQIRGVISGEPTERTARSARTSPARQVPRVPGTRCSGTVVRR